jgi:hypothetical protein
LITAGLVMNNVKTYKRTAPAAIILLFLIILIAIFSFIDEHRLIFPNSFSIEGLQSFYAGSTITNNILVQSFIQVSVALILLFILLLRNRISQQRFHAMLIIMVAADMIFASRMNLPVTVSSKFYTDSLNWKLREEPRGFPVSMEQIIGDVTHEGNGSYAPSYYNNNVFKKQIAFNSYNPFDLKNKDSLDHFAGKKELFHHPLLYFSNDIKLYPTNPSDSLVHLQKGVVFVDADVIESLEISKRDSLITSIKVKSFFPGKIAVSTTSNQQALLTLLQNYYPGWRVKLDGKPGTILKSNISMMSLAVPAGEHEVMFEYDPEIVRWLLWISIASQIILIVSLVIKGKDKQKMSSTD